MKAVTQWKCSSCPKTFGRKGDKTRHELLHEGFKPHKCGYCEKSFSQFSGKKTHENVHTGQKPYFCGIDSCMAAFGDPSSCARHRKETHRRIGAYCCPCPGCSSRIKRRSAFAAHLKKHGIDPMSLDLDDLAPPLLPKPVTNRARRSSLRIGTLEATHKRSFREEFKEQLCDLSDGSLPGLYANPQANSSHWSNHDYVTRIESSTPTFPVPHSSTDTSVDFRRTNFWVMGPILSYPPSPIMNFPSSSPIPSTSVSLGDSATVKVETSGMHPEGFYDSTYFSDDLSMQLRVSGSIPTSSYDRASVNKPCFY